MPSPLHRAARLGAPLALALGLAAWPARAADPAASGPPAAPPDAGAAPPPAGSTPPSGFGPVQMPELPAPLVPPDRTQPPWSQTAVLPVPIGEVEWTHEAGGVHARIGTARGSVHAWTPPGYAHRTAGVVLYVHGYYTDVDQAFVDHRLAEQFRASRRNALFVAAEAPSWNGDEVQWPELAALLELVHARTGLTLPPGPVVVAGHSGAIRTVLPWLADPRVEEILLLDGLYRGETELLGWLAAPPPPHARRRLVLVGDETASKAEALLELVPDAVRRGKVPDRLEGRERRARLVYLRSQYDHMTIVTGGRVLPALLRATRLAPLP